MNLRLDFDPVKIRARFQGLPSNRFRAFVCGTQSGQLKVFPLVPFGNSQASTSCAGLSPGPSGVFQGLECARLSAVLTEVFEFPRTTCPKCSFRFRLVKHFQVSDVSIFISQNGRWVCH